MSQLYPVVILAGGLATRLRPVTEKIPKALLDINGEPFISHQLRLLKKQGVQEVVLCIGYLGEMIQDFVGDGSRFGLSVKYRFDGPVLLGTGGTIKQALPLLGPRFFVLNGDSYLTCDYQRIQECFENGHFQGLMTVFNNQGLWDSSNIEYANGKIIIYDKKLRNARMQHIDYGLGILTPEAFASVPDGQPYDLALLNQTLISQKLMAAYEVKERFYEVGSFSGIEDFEKFLTEKNRVKEALL